MAFVHGSGKNHSGHPAASQNANSDTASGSFRRLLVERVPWLLSSAYAITPPIGGIARVTRPDAAIVLPSTGAHFPSEPVA